MSSKVLAESSGNPAVGRKRAQTATSTLPPTNVEGHRKRNLANQRNYRNRQKQYVEELEEKLRLYESEGVAATESVQQAARRVQQENAGLRRLLQAHLGWGTHEIDQRLSQGNERGIEQRPSAQREPANLRGDYLPMAWSTTTHSDSCDTNPTYPIYGRNERAATISASSSEQPYTPKDTISCEDAAAILAEFRSQGDLDLIKGELGCTPILDFQCSISHRDLFAKMADST